MNKILASEKVYVSQSAISNAGRGVFARVNIRKGEVVEKCPVIEIPEHDAMNINKSMLVTYVYYLGKQKERLTMVLGFGSIYNHASQPNAKYVENSSGKLIEFVAIQKISKGDEITVDYSGGNNKDRSPMWFEV